MGLDDKFEAAGDKLKGKLDEVVGKVTDDDSKVMKGKAEQAKGRLKDTAADLKAHVKETAEGDRVDRNDRRDEDEAAPGVSPVE